MINNGCIHCGKDIPVRIPGEFWERLKRFSAIFCTKRCKIDHHNLKRKIDRKQKALKKLETELWQLVQEMAYDHDWMQAHRASRDADEPLHPYFQPLIGD